MKLRYFCSLLLGLLTLGASAQTYTVLNDLTSKIQNSDFSEGTPVSTHVRTYDYDMPDKKGVAEGGEGLYGQQEVPGWTASNLTDNVYQDGRPAATVEGSTNGRAAGLFAYGLAGEEGSFGLGATDKYFAPGYVEGLSGNALAMTAVWGASLKYTQEVTLPAGTYALSFKVFNVSGAENFVENYFGFALPRATAYSSQQTYSVGEWVEDQIFVSLKHETTLNVSLGFKGSTGSGSVAHLYIDNVKLYEVDPASVTEEVVILDQAEIDAYKEDLLKVIEDGEDLGADTSDAQAVYDNANATLAEVQAAIEAQLALNEEKKVDLSDFFILNAHFMVDTPIPNDNGITTYDYDMPDPKGKNERAVDYFGMQPISGWIASHPTDNVLVGEGRGDQPINAHASGVFAIGSNSFLGGKGYEPPTTMSDGSTEGNVLGFVGVWSRSSQYTQNVTIPAGNYTLTISYYNAGGTAEIAKNLMGFIEEDGTEHLSDLKSFKVGEWGQMVISFELDEETNGKFSMGYTAANKGSADMPHFFIDGISLVYEGELEIDPSLFALQAVVNQGNTLLSDAPDFYQSLKDEFENAVSNGENLISSRSDDVEVNIAATEEIQSLMSQARENIQAYADLQEFYAKDLFQAGQKYTTGELGTQVSQMSTDVDNALSDFNWTTAKIRETIASLPNIIKAGVQAMWDAAVASGEKLEEDLDITPLFEQMAYTYSTTEYQGGNVPDKEWKYGSASNFKTQYGTAEVWNQSPFTVSRTLTELPAGRYTITTKAFYRTAENATNLDKYDAENPLAFVFAGNAKTPLTNVATLVSSEQSDGWVDAGENQFVPNDKMAAFNIFENSFYDEILTKSAAATLIDGGDLTFGITTDQMESNSWVIWYSFSITYNAVDEEGAAAELQALMQRVQDYSDDVEEETGFKLVTEAVKKIEDAISEGEGAEDGTLEVIKAAMSSLNSALDYAKKATELVETLNNTFTYYSGIRDEYVETHADFIPYDERFDELCSLVDDIDAYADNEEVQGYIEEFPIALVNYAMSQDMSGAAEDDPIEITLAILNYDFEAGNINHWVITGSGDDGKIGQNQGYQSASYENAAAGITVSKFVEAWRKDALLSNGDISQTIAAVLPEGYYVLEADAWSTNQTAIPEEGIQGVYLYAGNGEEIWRTPVGIATTSGAPEHFSVKFYSDGENETKVGLLVENTNANWIAADNFKLFYIGGEAPDAVEAVKDAAEGRIQAIYSVSGARQSTLARGLNIVKTTDGARKVLVK